ELEVEEADILAANLFRDKSYRALRGELVLPEDLTDHDLPADKVAEFTSARERLMKALNASARDKAPEDAAHAQTMFDCWYHEQEEDLEPADIAECRSEFLTALERAEDAIKPMAKPAAPQAMPVPEPKIEMYPDILYVLFDFDSFRLNAAAEEKVKEAISLIKGLNPSAVHLSGHADRAGTDEYNMKLSSQRVKTVIKALKDAGINLQIVAQDWHGELMPRIPTPDGQREPRNRRVEIQLQK
ncbi:MAG: OmpA family protein, partial [Rhodospirillales bacterium]|nr:OmpA family protein [Rhodospirillales bacterium]